MPQRIESKVMCKLVFIAALFVIAKRREATQVSVSGRTDKQNVP